VALVAVLALSGVAAARAPSSRTKIVVDESILSEGSDPLVELVGHLESPKRKCLAGRTVKLSIHYVDGSIERDVDRTGASGFWAVGGHDAGTQSARFEVTRKNVGRGHHRRICKAASKSMAFA
jgi:hypothetical protein